MILFGRIFQYGVLLHLLFQIATTTLHVYHVCIQNEIVPEFKPDPGLKLPGHVQLLFANRTADGVETLVTSAHQLCVTFYKAIVLEGSEIHHVRAVFSETRLVKDVDGTAIKRLAKQVRPQFRQLHEHVIFLEREILICLFQYKRSYETIHDTGIGRKGLFEFFDDFLRKRRSYAFHLDRKVQSIMTEAKREEGSASSTLMMFLFVTGYSIILYGFCGRHLRYILCFVALAAVVCYGYADFHWEKARELRAKADRLSEERYNILKEVRLEQDNIFRSRNATLTYFIKAADPKLVKQTYILNVLMTFTELVKRLHWIDSSLQRMTSLADALEVSKNTFKPGTLEHKSRPIISELKDAFRNITSYVETIAAILQ